MNQRVTLISIRADACPVAGACAPTFCPSSLRSDTYVPQNDTSMYLGTNAWYLKMLLIGIRASACPVVGAGALALCRSSLHSDVDVPQDDTYLYLRNAMPMPVHSLAVDVGCNTCRCLSRCRRRGAGVCPHPSITIHTYVSRNDTCMHPQNALPVQ